MILFSDSRHLSHIFVLIPINPFKVNVNIDVEIRELPKHCYLGVLGWGISFKFRDAINLSQFLFTSDINDLKDGGIDNGLVSK